MVGRIALKVLQENILGSNQAETKGAELSTEHHPQQAPPHHVDATSAAQQLLLALFCHFTMDLLPVLEAQQRVWFSFNTSVLQVGEAATLRLLF